MADLEIIKTLGTEIACIREMISNMVIDVCSKRMKTFLLDLKLYSKQGTILSGKYSQMEIMANTTNNQVKAQLSLFYEPEETIFAFHLLKLQMNI